MARDKLITIRIEGEKRDAFNQLAKSQNTDTASLLYDFISGCLDSRIDISLVTEKGQRIDNQLDDDRLNKIDNRIDKLETTTQRLAKRLDDWIEAIDDRLTDCDQGLSEKIITLEHRINALSFQLDRQDRQEIDNRIDDMDQLLRLQQSASIATSPLPTGEPSPPARPAIETVTPEVSPSPPSPPDQPAIASIDGTVTGAIEDSEKKIMESVGEPDSIDTLAAGDTSPTDDPAIKPAIKTMPETHSAIAKELGLKSPSTLTYWVKKGEIPALYEDRVKFSPDGKKIAWIGD
jgi:hypothetical protein